MPRMRKGVLARKPEAENDRSNRAPGILNLEFMLLIANPVDQLDTRAPFSFSFPLMVLLRALNRDSLPLRDEKPVS